MKTVPLGELAQFVMGQAPPGESCNESGDGTPFVKAGEFGERHPYIREWTTRPLQYAHTGDVLVCVVGATAGKVNLGVDCAIGRSVGAVRPLPGHLDQMFAYYFIRTQTVKLRGGSQGSAQGVITRGMLGALAVPVMPLAEQRRIADILDKADAIRRKRALAVSEVDELLRATFLDVFGDPVTNPKGWPSRTIAQLCDDGASLVDGPFGSSMKPEHYRAEGVRVIRNWNIYDDRFDASEFKFVSREKFEEVRRSEVRPGDVLITTKGTVGDVCLMPEVEGPSVLSASGTVRLRVPPNCGIDPLFLVQQMVQPTYKAYLHTFEAGSAQQYLNLSAIRKMRVLAPPASQQRVFLQAYARASSLRAGLKKAALEADHLFDALVQRAFTGELASSRPSARPPVQTSLFAEGV